MRLRPGANAQSARQAIRELELSVGNIYGEEHTQTIQLVHWVEQAETTLRNHFVDLDLAQLYTERFWRISVGDINLRSYMITHEQTRYRAWLQDVGRELDALTDAFGDLDAAIVVPDTNALLHYRLFDEIGWPEIVGRSPVSLTVPMAVVDELDRKKAAANKRLRERAATVIRHLRRHNGAQVRDGVTLTTIGSVDLGVGQRPAASLYVDVEILDTCEALAAFTTVGTVSLVSGDYGMELRAASRNVSLLRLPDDLRLALGEPVGAAADDAR